MFKNRAQQLSGHDPLEQAKEKNRSPRSQFSSGSQWLSAVIPGGHQEVQDGGMEERAWEEKTLEMLGGRAGRGAHG